MNTKKHIVFSIITSAAAVLLFAAGPVATYQAWAYGPGGGCGGGWRHHFYGGYGGYPNNGFSGGSGGYPALGG